MLTFKEEDHSYWVGEKRVPGVSEILKETGQAKDWTQVPAYYRDRGSAVHKAIELWLKGTLDMESLDPVIVPYFQQFVDWSTGSEGNSGFSGLWFSESPMYSPSQWFAGTIDLIANQTIYDVKCSKKLDKASQWQYQMQGAAYRTLVKENMKNDFSFKVLLLTGTGKAEEIPLWAPYEPWTHIMEIYRAKTQGGL